mgnify:CR=1 FL=1
MILLINHLQNYTILITKQKKRSKNEKTITIFAANKVYKNETKKLQLQN